MNEKEFLREFEPGKVTILKNDNKGPALPVIKKENQMTIKEAEDKAYQEFLYAKKCGYSGTQKEYIAANKISAAARVAWSKAKYTGYSKSLEDFCKDFPKI